MPVIVVVVKGLGLRARWAQIRRIRCAHCPIAFSYVVGGEERATAVGLPVLTSDESIRSAAANELWGHLAEVHAHDQRGFARCPACRRAQPWMPWRWFASHGRRLAAVAVITLPGLLCAGFSFGDRREEIPFSETAFLAAAGGVIVLVLLGGAIWMRWDLGSPERPDPRAMRDAELREFLADCAARDLDPALTWWFDRLEAKDPPEGVSLVSLPFLDLAGGFEPPGPVPPPVPPPAPPVAPRA